MKSYLKNATEKKAYLTPVLQFVIHDCEIECNSSFESKDNDFGANEFYQ